ncbi:glycoside hydrolase family 36 protein [Microbacterium marinilacus]|uniref:Alpha-galactosidase n=1 Tax=Microbacterium marinilacus TaxID=415209 RepID=A0ABP7BI06_9MICO|nr:glycoside hydrolase family 36 protein [Microbacterium marinilacus]MBY0687670.1 alpha-galactosidase [Microbacterium marinilacus]
MSAPAAPNRSRDIVLASGGVSLTLEAGLDAPASLVSLRVAGAPSALRRQPLVELFTATERHARMSLGYVGSALGERLRTVSVEQDGANASIAQRDATTGAVVTTRIALGDDGFRIVHDILNDGQRPLVVFALPTLTVRTAAEPAELALVSGRSEWLGEGRWSEQPLAPLLPELGFATVAQPDRTGPGQSSSGGWSTGSVYPLGALVGAGTSVGWQIESSAGWQWSLSRGDGGVVLSAGGPTEREHHGELVLAPGQTFTTVTAACVAAADRDGVFAALTRHRRRLRAPRAADAALPVVYNDYMNTLMGQPTTEALRPLIAAAAEAGAEVFCIDAGWFTDSVDYWSEVGAWQDAPTRFREGLAGVIADIRAAGLQPGLWLEPESVGLDSPVVDALPEAAFFSRHGAAVVEQRRRHLDLRHPAARRHLDDTVDRLVAEHGIRFLKIDYNIEPGSGTDAGGLAAGQGLLAHTRALREWLVDVQRRHPDLLVENCASGAMRSDYHLLAVTHLQSTSDQQDATRYAAIAASAPASVLPEQAGNWAYPSAGMDDGELALTLVSGLSGRLYLAGFLDSLTGHARERVAEAVRFAKEHRATLAESVPFWPTGLPRWDDDLLTLGRRLPDGDELLFVWSRGPATALALPGVRDAERVFDGAGAWSALSGPDGLSIEVPAGPDAAVFRIHRTTGSD